MAEGDTPAIHIVRAHFDGDLVANHRSNSVLLHPAGGVGKNLVVILEPNSEPTFRQKLGDLTLEFDQLFFSQ